MRKAMFVLLGLVLTLSLVTGCGKKGPAVGEGMTVKLNYKGTLTDGTVFDTSEGKEPLEFNYGTQQIIPALETALEGLKAGDKKSVTVKAAEAYGEYDQEAIFEYPKDQLPPELANVEAGTQLYFQSPQGPMPVKVTEIKDTTVMIDFNHPLAGKDLTFDVEIVEVAKTEAAPAEFMPPIQAPTEEAPVAEPAPTEPAPAN